jgi:superfamily II DNA or RNA helicase
MERMRNFFGSQNIFNEETNEAIIRWKKLIITRNNDCKLATNLQEKHRLFIDKTYSRDELISYCQNLITTPPQLPITGKTNETIRDYQQECIDLIVNSNENVIISLPTGTGKNFIIVHSLEMNKKYLILVPRIILLEQIQEEIKKYKPKLKNKIQLIGDSNDNFDDSKDITICVYNSVKIIEEHSNKFHKIFVDEAHHINKPEIYYNDDEPDDEPDDIDGLDDVDDVDDYESGEDASEEEDSQLEDDASGEEYSEEEDSQLEDDASGEEYSEEEDSQLEDEINNKTTYIDTINNLIKYNNNVYLSATIDKKDGFKYYEKNIRDMINKKYLCDYTINIPVFSDDPTNKNICEYLLNQYRNIIIYCNSQKEGQQINNLLNKIQNNSSEYIDCNTPKQKRKKIIEKYKSGELPFLVNVRILVEGFDAPITKGVCFMHLPSSKTTLIQIIGRALRLHPLKTYASIILPFSSKEDETSIIHFMKVMAKNDSRIRKSYESKKIGGYINIEKQKDKESDDIDELNNNIEFKYNLIFDSMGVMKNSEEIWMKRLEEVKKYINENGKRPTKQNNELKCWISHQLINSKKRFSIMKNDNIYNLWNEFINDDRYKKYFDNDNIREWKITLEEVKKYMNDNNKRPSNKLGNWICAQIQNAKQRKQIMKNDDIYNLWVDFIEDNKYKKYFITNEEEWKLNLEQVKKYINDNNEKPIETNKNQYIRKMSRWITVQKRNYELNDKIMKNNEIYFLWNEFINDARYKKYFDLDNIRDWQIKLEEVKKYMDDNNKRPSENNNLNRWITRNLRIYKNKEEIMKNQEIYLMWENFVNDCRYKKYFISNEEEWKNNLEKVKKYMDDNNEKPIEKKDEYLSRWIEVQKRNYKNKEFNMKNDEIYFLWNEFINNVNYRKYFLSNKEEWILNLEKIKKYMDDNNKRPSEENKIIHIKKLGQWIRTQLINYESCKNIMTDIEIYNLWNEFINDSRYKKYFITNEERWKENFNKYKNFINLNNTKPTSITNYELHNWQNRQLQIYKKKDKIMKDPDIRKLWEDFTTLYSQYFPDN